MTSAGRRVVPVYPTLAASVLRRSTDWRAWFPFNAPGGDWTFSGRVALYRGLQHLRLPPGSVILVPNYHQGVEIETLIAAGFELRYYRVDERLEIDLRDVDRQLDGRVSALYVTHYFGFPQPLTLLRAFCDAHRIALIEDCALSLFSRDGHRWLGTVGDLAIFSVYKTLPIPHGGYLVTRGEHEAAPLTHAPFSSTIVQTVDLAQHTLRATRWAGVEHWIVKSSRALTRLIRWNRDHTIQSGGACWDQRLLGHGASRVVKTLMRLVDRDRVIAVRRRNFMRLASHLTGLVVCPFTELPPGVCPLFFPIMVSNKVRFQQELLALGVESVNLWNASHATCPPRYAAEVQHWRDHCLELPIHQELSERTIDRVAAHVSTVCGQRRAA